jgi:hypothetical protein
MRLYGLAFALVVLAASVPALGQVPAVPAPAPVEQPEPPPTPPAPEPPPPEPAPQEATPEPEPPGDAAPEAPAPVAATPPPAPEGPVEHNEIEPKDAAKADKPVPPVFPRARSPLTVDARLGFSWRPEGASGFDDEDTLGSELGASAYFELKREIAAGVEIERTSLGRGTAMSGLDSASIDYTVTSLLLGFKAYPRRSDLLDLFVGFQVGAGIQSVSASGIENNGGLVPASVYTCSGSDTPALQIGGGIGARFMLSPRWGLTARVNGTGRRLTGELVDDCARGLGTATSVSGSLGLGYDFDMDG